MRRLIQIFIAVSFFLASGPLPNAPAQTQAPIPPLDVRLGAVEAWMEPEAAAELRVGWDRMVVRWSLRQPDSAKQWIVPPEETERINTALAAGREMVILIMGTPDWATDGETQGGTPFGLYLPLTDGNNLWATFIRRFVQDYTERFEGKITRFIIWNEPDIAPDEFGAQFTGSVRDYYQLVKTASIVAKGLNPRIKIHLAGMTHWHDVVFNREPYLQRFLKIASQDPSARSNNFYFDVVTLHIYFRTETVRAIIDLFRHILSANGLKHPIWLNETNAPPADDAELPWNNGMFQLSMDEQSAFLVQAFALSLASGAERVSVYKLFNFTATPGADYYGLIRPDGSRRPAVEAFRLITNQFAGVRRVSLATYSSYYLVRLERKDAVVRVLWARGPQAVALNLQPTRGANVATLYNAVGQTQPLVSEGKRWPLTLAAANCLPPKECIVGGAPLVLVETLSTKKNQRMTYSPFEPPKSRNPKTQAAIEKETFWQIMAPLGVVVLLIGGLMVFIGLSAFGVAVPTPTRSLADVSLMTLIGLASTFGLIVLLLLIGLCVLVGYGLIELPYIFRRAQDWLWLATMHVKTYSQQVDVRVVDLRQSIAAVQSVADSLQSFFTGKGR